MSTRSAADCLRRAGVGSHVGDAQFEPMAYWLAKHGVDATTLNLRHSGGSAWICEHGTCGATDLGTGRDLGDAPFVRIDAGVPGHDGFYYAGRLTASPPAARAHAASR